MTERVTGRHRAPDRASTPLTTFTSTLSTVVGGSAAGVGRGGLVLAMSSGLVAGGMGVPADAAVAGSGTPQQATGQQATGATQALPPSFVGGEPVSAPADARVTFERSAFTATAKPKPAPTQTVTSASRSGVRAGRTATTRKSVRTVTTRSTGSVRGSSVIAVAARYLGVPYVSGGTTPRGFDCSGYTRYVYAQVDVRIPRVAEAQRQAATTVPRSAARPGDLVFFLSGGSAYHVGIYAGGNMMYDAGKPGQVVTKRAIWSGNVTFGRF